MTLAKNKKSSPLICNVEYALPEDIQAMENVELNQVRITMKPGKTFNPIYATPASHSFSEPSDVSAAGLLYKPKLNLYYPGIEKNTHDQLLQLEYKKAVYKITYQHGLIQVIGSLDVPAKLFNSFASSESTGNSITITCESDERARFLIE